MTRDEYGALVATSGDALEKARSIVASAVKAKRLPRPHESIRRVKWDRREGSAVRNAIIDIRGGTVLLQMREVEVTRFGFSERKAYKLVRRVGRGFRVADAPKANSIIKLAKADPAYLGHIIETISGKAKRPLRTRMPAVQTWTAYKVVKQTRDGNFVSCYDGSPWPLGKRRAQAAREDFEGGFYYYDTVEDCRAAPANIAFIGQARAQGARLVILECEVSGNQIPYADPEGRRPTKWAASFLRPIKMVEVFECAMLEAEAA